jgi:serine/threonine-protein kinase ULK/ATG1
MLMEVWFPALTWFKGHFMKCNDRASLVKTWLPSRYTGAPHYLDQMIYDHALSLVCLFQKILTVMLTWFQSRSAARKELLDQATSPDECEKLYEESLWCLYALQDDLLQDDNPFLQEDRETIATCKFFCVPHSYLADDDFNRDQEDETASFEMQS